MRLLTNTLSTSTAIVATAVPISRPRSFAVASGRRHAARARRSASHSIVRYTASPTMPVSTITNRRPPSTEYAAPPMRWKPRRSCTKPYVLNPIPNQG